MTKTQQVQQLGETIPTLTRTQWAQTIEVECTDCLSVDDPADCPTCAGERYVAVAR